MLVNEQIECLRKINQIVRDTESVKKAVESGRHLRLPTGDGMALLFFRSPEEPARCALEISRELKKHPEIKLRMGIHSGPVSQVRDVNDTINIAGAGINVAQRVMDCGDAGHILVSRHVADDLAEYRHWQPYLRDIGEAEVKHGLRLHLFNLCKEDIGNCEMPEKLKRRRWKQGAGGATRPAHWFHWGWAFLALLVCAIAVAAGLSFFLRRSEPAILVPEKSIAVLPFENLSTEKENAFFTEGVQDEILTNLARVADLKVISRTSVMQYRSDLKRNLRDISRALGVAYVVEGSVQRAGEKVKINAQLVDARTDTQIWGDKYSRALKDVFAIQTEVAEKIVSDLKSKLSPAEKAAIERPPTNDLAAFDLYNKAKRTISNAVIDDASAENLSKAIGLLEQAVKRDPSFLLAYYQLAHAHDQIYLLGFDHTPARLAQANAAIQAIQRIRPDSGEAHLALAKHLYWGYLDYDRAREELRIAQLALPNDPLSFLLAAYIDRRQGRWAESTSNMERALELDPQNLLVLQQMSLNYENERRYADTAAVLDRALMLAPDQSVLRRQRANIDLSWRADTKPLHAVIDSIRSEKPEAAADASEDWLYLSLCEHDPKAASQAVAVMPVDGCGRDGIPFSISWCQGLAARAQGDTNAAREAFGKARTEVEKLVSEQPSYAQAFCALGMIDAALGRKKEAVQNGRRSVELLPITRDAVDGAVLMQYLAIIYAWSGETEAALEELDSATKVPGYLSYGQLRLHPYWDPLRREPRFTQILESMAPK